MSCYRNILVAVDGSDHAAAALEHACLLASDQHARLTLLTVVQHQPAPLGPGSPPAADLTEAFAEILRRTAAEVPSDIGVTTRLEHGDPAAAILEVASDGDHDLIVMGSHGYGLVRGVLLGSISRRVLQDATVPVLVLRGEGAAVGEPAAD